MESSGPYEKINSDVLSQLNDGLGVWRSIDENNALLNRPGTKQQRAANEELALYSAKKAIGNNYLRREKVIVTGLGQAASRGSLELMSVKGRYRTLVAMTDRDSGERHIALRVKTGRGEKSKTHLFPLNRNLLAQFDVETRAPEEWIDMEAYESNHDIETPAVDLLDEHFDDTYREQAGYIETSLKYSMLMADSEQERQIELEQAVRDLESEMPLGELLERMYVTGFVLDMCSQEPEFYDGEVVNGVADIIEVKDGYQSVVEAQVLSADSEEVKIIYIIPSHDYLFKLETSNEAELPRSNNIVDLFHDEAIMFREVTGDPKFYALTLEEQRSRLAVYANEIQDHLAALADYFDDRPLDFMVAEHKRLPSELLGLGWNHPLSVKDRFDEDRFRTIRVDVASVFNPDIDDGERTEPLMSSREFALSDGEPTLVLENQQEGMCYLVRIRDIVEIAPVYETGE